MIVVVVVVVAVVAVDDYDDVICVVVVATSSTTTPRTLFDVPIVSSFLFLNTNEGYFWSIRRNSLTLTSQHGLVPL